MDDYVLRVDASAEGAATRGRTVALVGALDTKAEDYAFVKALIESHGLRAFVIDFGVVGEPGFAPDVTSQEVASSGGALLDEYQSGDRKDRAMQVMADGLAEVVLRLHREGRVHGILGMGGSCGTSIATAAMRGLPTGLPKVMVSTLGGGDVSAFCGAKDIVFFPSVVDVSGINRISRTIYENAANAIAGMVRFGGCSEMDSKPAIAASMFGNTTKAVGEARARLEQNGYEVLVFHATGAGGRTMEDLIGSHFFDGVLDFTTTELADFVCGGVYSAGPDRCLAAPHKNLPVVLVPGCVDMVNFGRIDSVPEKYRGRNLYEWNPDVTLMRTNAEENFEIGKLLARAANASEKNATVMLPLQGLSMLDSKGGPFWDPSANNACFSAIREHLRSEVPLVEVDANINDPVFSQAGAERLLSMIAGSG